MEVVSRDVRVPRKIFKDIENLDRFSCIQCNSLLQDPVQLGCGHRVCRHCADELISNTDTSRTVETTPRCPECDEEISEEDGVKVNIYYKFIIIAYQIIVGQEYACSID